MDEKLSIKWDDIKVFLAVHRAGSLRGAAREMAVNHATVNRRLVMLEQSLGALLFERRPEGFVISQAGEDLLPSAEKVESEFLTIARRVAGQDDRPRGVVRLNVPPAMLASFLVEELVGFTREYPEIELDVDASHNFADLARREADVSIRMVSEVTDDVVGRRVIDYAKSVYASPELIASFPSSGPDAEQVSWIGWGENYPYTNWTRDTPFPDLPVRHRLFSNILQLEAAQKGLGLALLPAFLGDAAPGLHRVPGVKNLSGKSIWLLFHGDMQKVARVRALIDFLVPAILRHRRLIKGESANR